MNGGFILSNNYRGQQGDFYNNSYPLGGHGYFPSIANAGAPFRVPSGTGLAERQVGCWRVIVLLLLRGSLRVNRVLMEYRARHGYSMIMVY